MKYAKSFSTLLVASSLLVACSGGSGSSGSPTKDSDSLKPSSSGTSSSANAQFSCLIDGQPVSGGTVDDQQQYNTAFIVDVDQGKELLFSLQDSRSAQPNFEPPHSLRFAVPYKVGKSSFGHEENGWGIMVDILADKNHTVQYNSDSFTIDITSLSATRVSGTFSGKFRADTPDGVKDMEITDGKFDIPFSSHVRPN